MSSSRPRMSLGAVALVLCLALPMGLISLYAPATASDQLETADAVVLARVSAVQISSANDVSHLALLVQDRLIGAHVPLMQRFELPGRTALRPGDTVLALIDSENRELVGSYFVEKGREGYSVVERVEGFEREGLSSSAGQSLDAVVTAFQIRLGLIDGSEQLDDGASDDDKIEGTAGDFLEPNDDLASASPIFLNTPVMVTGLNPLLITGLSITPGDVDFFSFDAPGSTILHAETRLPAGATSTDLDTLLGFFDGLTGELISVDDDGGAGASSRLVAPVERMGTNGYAIAVQSAPDSDLDFSGDEGTTSGLYELLVELEKATYIGNGTDQVMGVSPDGTFIEDFVGFREVYGEDVLTQGVPGDGWGLSFDATIPSGATTIFGGSGDFLSPPAFGHEVRVLGFDFGLFTDENGTNRTGAYSADAFLQYQAGSPVGGARILQDYTIGLNQSVTSEAVTLRFLGKSRIENLAFTRLLDIDMFDEGGDTFHWSFPPHSRIMAFPVSTTDTVGSLTLPAASEGSMTGDLQAALVASTLDGEGLQPTGTFQLGLTFTLVIDFANADDAVQSAAQNLIASDAEGWIIAVDADPDTGLFTAFGVGLEDRND